MAKTFIIAEAALTWLHGGLEAAYRSIRAAKECGADAWKTQWTSDHESMEMRRGAPRDQYKRLQWAGDCLPKLKEECDRVGIEFLCTTFIPQDVDTMGKYVKRFKVSAFESEDMEHLSAHGSKPVIVSVNPGKRKPVGLPGASFLWCISQYPAPPESLELSRLHHQDGPRPWDGFSDHTTSTLTGAVAVGAGARIIEKHVRLSDTHVDDPDFGHSLCLTGFSPDGRLEGTSYSPFKTYVDNIREAERML
jgi:N,N'-diacetyllegionaminate synthase